VLGHSLSQPEWIHSLYEGPPARVVPQALIAMHRFELPAEKDAFCFELANFIQARAAEVDQAEQMPEDCRVAALQAARMLLCDRDSSLEPLFADETLSAFAIFAKKLLGTESAAESLKCLNNALFDHEPVQKRFCAIPAEKGFGCLVHVLHEGEKHQEEFQRCTFVCMFISAGGQEDDSSAVSLAFAEATIATLTKIALQFDKLAGREQDPAAIDFFSGPNDGQERRQALVGGLRLLYAIAATHSKVTEVLTERSQRHVMELTGGSPEKLAELVASLSLSREEVPSLDRLGLLLIAIMKTKDEKESEERRAALDELKDQAITVLMLACNIKGFVDFLVERGTVAPILALLQRRIDTVLADKPTERSVQYFKELLPLVITCTNLCQKSLVAREAFRAKVFEEELPAPDLSGLDDKAKEAKMNERKMEGCTPEDSFGGRLIHFMTCLESNLKRYAGELLFVLCNEDAGEMTRRCGYGRSAHILAIKGGTIGGIIAQQEAQQREREAQQREQQDGTGDAA